MIQDAQEYLTENVWTSWSSNAVSTSTDIYYMTKAYIKSE